MNKRKPVAKKRGESPPPPIQQNFFLKRDQMEVLESIEPGSVKRILDASDRQQNHDNAVDSRILSIKSRESWLSYLVTIGVISAFAVLLFMRMVKEASIFGGFLVGLAFLVKAMDKKRE